LPAVRAMVADEESALLVPPGDARALAAAVDRILGDEALGRRLGAAASAVARERFSLTRMSAETLRYFERVLAAG